MARWKSLAAALGALAFLSVPALASEQQAHIDKAKLAIDEMRSDVNLKEPVAKYLKEAKAVMIFPNAFKAGFIIGGEGGSGLLLVKGPDGTWSDPAFYVLANGSFGLQIGAKTSQILLMIMTDGGLDKVMHASVKLGGDVSVAVGPVGAGASGATTLNAGADLIAFERSEGIYGGVALDGGVISSRDEWNWAYYSSQASPTGIVINRQFTNPGAEPLKKSLALAAGS
jgi:lipid-binding SYLF domain-containing protein